MQTYPPHTKNSLEARLPAIPTGMSSKGERETQSVPLHQLLENVHRSNMIIRKQFHHSTNLPFAYVVISPLGSNHWTWRTAEFTGCKHQVFSRYSIILSATCIYFFTSLTDAKSMPLFLSRSFSYVMVKGFECCAPNPSLPFNSGFHSSTLQGVVIFTSHSSTAAYTQVTLMLGHPTPEHDTLLGLWWAVAQDAVEAGASETDAADPLCLLRCHLSTGTERSSERRGPQPASPPWPLDHTAPCALNSRGCHGLTHAAVQQRCWPNNIHFSKNDANLKILQKGTIITTSPWPYTEVRDTGSLLSRSSRSSRARR